MKYRKIPIIVINLFFVFLIIKALFFDDISDTNSIFAVIMFILLVFFNAYAILLHTLLRDKNNILYEILFYAFIITPIILLYYISTI